jgi:hypothetical protein
MTVFKGGIKKVSLTRMCTYGTIIPLAAILTALCYA